MRLASSDTPPPLRDPARPAERFLAGFPSLNPFSAAALLAAQPSLRRLVTLPPDERSALAAAVPGITTGSLELFYRQLEYGSRLVPAAARGVSRVRQKTLSGFSVADHQTFRRAGESEKLHIGLVKDVCSRDVQACCTLLVC